MFSKSKYVVGIRMIGRNRTPVAILFPEAINHDDLAIGYFGSADCVLGAGFFHLVEREGHETKAVPYGDSVTLKLDSRPQDASYIEYALGLIDELPGELVLEDRKLYEQKQAA